MSTSNAPTKRGAKVPLVIGYGTARLSPLLEIWAANNPDVPWARLIERALKKELAPLAGKKFAHLVN